MMRLVGGAVALVAAAGVLAGCGSGSSSAVDPDAGQPTAGSSSPSPSHTTSSAASDLPACSKVWQAGAKLPQDYQGCVQGTSETRADRLGCSSGQRMVRFDNHWYAVLGGQIHHSRDLVHDAQYLHSVRVCRG